MSKNFKPYRARRIPSLGVLPLVLSLFIGGLRAQEVVTNIGNDGVGSLRQAIADVVDDGTITFDAELSGQTIVLGGRSLGIKDKSLSIDASALTDGIVISGNQRTSVFWVDETGGLLLDSVWITEGVGYDGGGIYSRGELQMFNCTVSDCVARGYDFSSGGGIHNGKPGDCRLTNCTLFNNRSEAIARQVHILSGAIFTAWYLRMHHCTITANEGGVGVASGRKCFFRNTVIAGNTEADVTYNLGQDPNFFWSSGNNVIGFGNAVDGSVFTKDGDVTGVIDPKLSVLFNNGGPTPTCSPLPGSPLLDGAWGTGHTSWTPLTTDQREQARPAGSAPEIGAVELRAGESVVKALVVRTESLIMSEAYGTTMATVSRTTGSGGGALTVSLISSDITEATVPATIVIPDGEISTEFVVTAVDDGEEDGSGEVMITATASSFQPGTDIITIADDEAHTTVTTLADSGPGSLRQAMLDVPRFGRVSFAQALNGATIQLGGVDSDRLQIIRREYTIDASDLSDGVTVSGDGEHGIFYIENSRITFDHLTIADGEGGIYASNSDITLNYTSVERNTLRIYNGQIGGAGISLWGGVCTIRNSTISDNSALTMRNTGAAVGGGIYAHQGSTILIENSTISGNYADAEGGGIHVGPGQTDKSILINNSTISNNHSGRYGGGFSFVDGEATLLNCTLIGNTADQKGGGISARSQVTITHCTVSGNTAPDGEGSGLSIRKSIITNSIIAGNTNSDIDSIDPRLITSLGHNLIGNGNGAGVFIETGDETGQSDPMLAPLGQYGGTTLTLGLLPGSPAIDAGAPDPDVTTDQRGRMRPAGAAPDIGAFELQPAESFGLSYTSYAALHGMELDPAHADNDGNGNSVPDLLDYVMGLPERNLPDTMPHLLPVGSTNEHPRLLFILPAEPRPDAVLTVKSSSSLQPGSWGVLTIKDGTGPWTGPATVKEIVRPAGCLEITVELTETIGESGPAFMRLEATLQ